MQDIKCVIVGDSGVGKTSLASRFLLNQFPYDYRPPYLEIGPKNLIIDEKLVNVHVWDTIGVDDYDRLRPLSYHLTDVFLICFSIVDYRSFKSVKEKWYPEVSHQCPKTPVILVGTKLDLRDDLEMISNSEKNQIISFSEGLELMNEINAAEFLGTL